MDIVTVSFSFYSIAVQVIGQKNLIDKLKLDFSFFVVEPVHQHHITVKADSALPGAIPANMKKWMNYKDAEIYDRKSERYVKYGDRGLVHLDFKNENYLVVSKEKDLSHELTYLLVLSRVGKYLDLKGLHRIHACAFSLGEELFVFPSSSGGGKSTLLLQGVSGGGKIYSDDTPLVNSKGDILPFPIRLGFNKSPSLPSALQGAEQYTLKRREYGEKFLVSLKDQERVLGSSHDSMTICLPRKVEVGGPRLKSIHWVFILIPIFKYLVIGVGTPVVFEFFWERGPSGFYKKLRIFGKRLVASFWLIWKSRKREFRFSLSGKENISKLIGG